MPKTSHFPLFPTVT